MKHKGLLFDLDGVIADTAKYHYIAWKQVADELKIEFTEADNERLKGVSRMSSFEIILEIGGITMSVEDKELYCEKKNDIYVSYIERMTEEEILPGVRKFLTDAKNKDYKISLGSASKNSGIILKGLKITNLFDAIIDGTCVSKAKPDPEVFILGAKALGLKNSECIVFEDAVAGIEAAHNGNIPAVGVGSKELLPNADYNIPGFEGILIDEIEEKIEEGIEEKIRL
jgi:beta-phosphoglucomutase